jgi:alpha-mannosidase
VPGAQLRGAFEAELAILCGVGDAELAAAAREAELALVGVAAGASPLAPPDAAMLELEPRELVLSAFKPAEDGHSLVLRALNPTDAPVRARVRLGFPFAEAAPVRLDETRAQFALERADDALIFEVPAHALRSVRVTLQALPPARR